MREDLELGRYTLAPEFNGILAYNMINIQNEARTFGISFDGRWLDSLGFRDDP
jgi:hypothetical protein